MKVYKAKQNIFSPFTGRMLFAKGNTYEPVTPKRAGAITLATEFGAGVTKYTITGEDVDLLPMFEVVNKNPITPRTINIASPKWADSDLKLVVGGYTYNTCGGHKAVAGVLAFNGGVIPGTKWDKGGDLARRRAAMPAVKDGAQYVNLSQTQIVQLIESLSGLLEEMKDAAK